MLDLLIKYFVYQTKGHITKTQLVKFLYLADLYSVIPLTSSSRERDKGLPTAYPLKATSKNGLDQDSFALVHQIVTIDGNSFKN